LFFEIFLSNEFFKFMDFFYAADIGSASLLPPYQHPALPRKAEERSDIRHLPDYLMHK
jgi:hypothetical protein